MKTRFCSRPRTYTPVVFGHFNSLIIQTWSYDVWTTTVHSHDHLTFIVPGKNYIETTRLWAIKDPFNLPQCHYCLTMKENLLFVVLASWNCLVETNSYSWMYIFVCRIKIQLKLVRYYHSKYHSYTRISISFCKRGKRSIFSKSYFLRKTIEWCSRETLA